MKNFIISNKIFVLFTLLFSFWYIDIWENSNSCSRVLPIVTFYEQGNFVLDKYKDKTIDISFVDGHYYMDKAPLPSLLTIPFFGLLKFFGLVNSVDGSYYGKAVYIVGAIVCGIIPFVLILFFFAKTLVLKGHHDLVLMAFATLFSSFVFIFAGTFFAHVLAAFLVLLAYIHYQKSNFILAGLFCGAAFLTEYTTIWILLSWLLIEVIKRKSIKTSLQMMLGFLPALALILTYNYYFTGNPFTMLYLFVADNFDAATKSTYGLGLPKLKALFGLLFSDSRGLLFYAPILIYGIFLQSTQKTVYKMAFSRKYLLHPVLLPFIFTVLFISSHAAWEGGWSYGPRHLTAVSTLLMYAIVQSNVFGQYKALFWLLASYGLGCTFLAKLTVIYSIPELNQPVVSYLISKLKDNFNDGNILSLVAKQSPFTAFLVYLLLFVLMVFLRPKKTIHQ